LKSGFPIGTLAVIGGTGKLGTALARRWVRAGLNVQIGSRDPAKAAQTASTLSREFGREVGSGSNPDVARASDILVVTVPFAAQVETLTQIQPYATGKLVIDTTVPLVPPKVMRVQLPPEGGAALRAQRLLGDAVTLASAFHNVAAHKLALEHDVDCDVLVFSDDKAARERVVSLARAAGLRGVQGGPLANSVAAEALTSVLIFINRTYAVDGAGVRITGELIEPP
jgi:NADPH-dependent F420 reductase